MKKIISIVLIILLVLPQLAIGEATDTTEKSESEFTTVLLKKGSLLIKQFIKYGRLPEANRELFGASIEAATLIDAETGRKYQAARIEHYHYNSQYEDGKSVSFLDSYELDDVLATLDYIKEHLSEQKDYTEIVYTASSGLEIGAYYRSQDDQALFIRYRSYDTSFFQLSQLSQLSETFAGIKAMFDQ